MTEHELKSMIDVFVEYDVATLIAAKFCRAGGSEEIWYKIYKSKNLSNIPHPVIVGIHNAIRNIERGIIKLDLIPDIFVNVEKTKVKAEKNNGI